MSLTTISGLTKKAYAHTGNWRNRSLQGGRYLYIYVDGVYLRRNWGGEFENVVVARMGLNWLLAISVLVYWRLWEGIPRSQVPALYRTLLPQCVLCNASFQREAGSQDAQGDPRSGEQES